MLKKQGYDAACDVWSLGVLLFTMLAGQVGMILIWMIMFDHAHVKLLQNYSLIGVFTFYSFVNDDVYEDEI